ncbi:hypothetical protein pb186bvf_019092 [Paramecium bursaria]
MDILIVIKITQYFIIIYSSCIYLGVGKQCQIIEFQSPLLIKLENLSFKIYNDATIAYNFIGTRIQYQLKGQDLWKDFYVIYNKIRPGENSYELSNNIQTIKKLRIYYELSKVDSISVS